MTQELPKFHETFNPILDILADYEVIHTREMQKRVIEKRGFFRGAIICDDKR